MIYLATYYGSSRGIARLTGAAIRWVTRSRWSHCEIALGNPLEGPVTCISSSALDWVRAKTMQLDPSRWAIIPLDDISEANALVALQAYKGQGYDWLGAFRFAVPLLVRQQHPRRWFCSELCALIMGLQDPWRFSPADLFVIAKRIEDSKWVQVGRGRKGQ